MIKTGIIDLSVNQDSFSDWQRDLRKYCILDQRNGFSGDYPDYKTCDLFLLTGSEYSIMDNYPWLENLEIWIRSLIDNRIPLVGICYGHQLIARALNGKNAVAKSKFPEMSFIEIDFNYDHWLFNQIDRPLKMMSAHYDMVLEVPPGFEVIASSEYCPVQTMIDESRKVLGLQFHPEIDTEKAVKCIAKERSKLNGLNINVDRLIQQIPEKRNNHQVIYRNIFQNWFKGRF